MRFIKSKTTKRVVIIALVCLLLFGIIGGIAYFTDQINARDTGTFGTVDVSLVESEFPESIYPGEYVPITLAITSEGNKSIDVRTIVTVSSNVPLTELSPEFEIVHPSDVAFTDDLGYHAASTAQHPFSAYRSFGTNKTSVSYIFPSFVLDGNALKYGDVREIGDAAKANNTVTLTNCNISIAANQYSAIQELCFVFNPNASNDFMNADVVITIEVQVKQHQNSDDSWQTVASLEV